jgi:hypothetical protein
MEGVADEPWLSIQACEYRDLSVRRDASARNASHHGKNLCVRRRLASPGAGVHLTAEAAWGT